MIASPSQAMRSLSCTTIATIIVLALGCAQPNRAPGPAAARANDGGAETGRPDGRDGDDDGGLTPFTCLPGAPCAVADSPCMVGTTVCSDAGPSCRLTEKRQANGTFCGPGAVCLEGVCAGCISGAGCVLEGKTCRVGAIDCSSGQPLCVETGNAPSGSSCSPPAGATGNFVCQDGACATCTAGAACVPSNPCHRGVLDCTNGTATCKDSGMTALPGTPCGADKACNAAGACITCRSGAACPAPEVCRQGRIDCSNGAEVCLASESLPNGTACGSGNAEVCSAGSCIACNPGAPCSPSNRCHLGVLSCSSGTPQCMDSNTAVVNGTPCGTDKVCGNGSCVACKAAAACATGDPCKLGTTSCSTGTSECKPTHDAPDGTTCGQGRVCKAGSCVACAPNATCEPSACKVGKTSCGTGTSVCMETGAAPDGKACGGGKVCTSGSCVACGGAGQPCCAGNSCPEGKTCMGSTCVVACTPGGECNINNPCRKGKIACNGGTPACVDGDPKNNGASCGGNQICLDGSCTGCGAIGQPCCGGVCSVSGGCRNSRCAGLPNPPGGKFFIQTFGTAIGLLAADCPSDNAPGRPGCVAQGELFAARNYVYCRTWGAERRVGNDFNHWWLLTDLDKVYPGRQGRAYVSAYHIAGQGNDQANGIPDCP
jgi:hypothetical protein